jgi:hypothetical protein
MKYRIIWIGTGKTQTYKTNNQNKAIRYYRYLCRTQLFVNFYDDGELI